MIDDSILIKGNRDGLNIIINFNMFKDFAEMVEKLIEKLSKGKKFYKDFTVKITTQLKLYDESDLIRLKDILFQEFKIKDCIFEDKEENNSKVFSGIYEGRTKFIRKTIRSGQTIDYPGNVVIIGDVNPGSEIHAGGNIIIMGSLRGHVFAGVGGNDKAFVAAFLLDPPILQIAGLVTRSPEDEERPRFPEVAKIRDNTIIVEPYLPNKYI